MTKKSETRKQEMREGQARARALVLSIFKTECGDNTSVKLSCRRVVQRAHMRTTDELTVRNVKAFDGLILWALDDLTRVGEIEEVTSIVEKIGAMGRGERVSQWHQVFVYRTGGKTAAGVDDAS